MRRQELWFNTNNLPFMDFVLDGVLHFYYKHQQYPTLVSANWLDVTDELIRREVTHAMDLVISGDLPVEIPIETSQGLLQGHIMLWGSKETK